MSHCTTIPLAAGNKKLNGQKVFIPSLAQLCHVDCFHDSDFIIHFVVHFVSVPCHWWKTFVSGKFVTCYYSNTVTEESRMITTFSCFSSNSGRRKQPPKTPPGEPGNDAPGSGGLPGMENYGSRSGSPGTPGMTETVNKAYSRSAR